MRETAFGHSNGTKDVILDSEMLEEQTMGDRVLQKELFRVFFVQGAHFIDAIHDASSEDDEEGWKMAAHGLRGSACALGLNQLSSLARRAEREGQPDAMMAQSLSQAMAEARAYISRYWPLDDPN